MDKTTESKMLMILAEEVNEDYKSLKELYDDGQILLCENAHEMLSFIANEKPNGTLIVTNLYDWGWALDMRASH